MSQALDPDIQQICERGDEANAYFSENPPKAIPFSTDIYHSAAFYHLDLANHLRENKHRDPFLSAKVTLGYLTAILHNRDSGAEAYSIWTKQSEHEIFDAGIGALERGKTSARDETIYHLACAHLQSFGADLQAAVRNVQHHTKIVLDYAQRHDDSELVRIAVSNWKKHLEEIAEAPYESLPEDIKAPIEKALQLHTDLTLKDAIGYPMPDSWLETYPRKKKGLFGRLFG